MRYWLVASLALGACTVGPDFEPPAPPEQAGFADASARGDAHVNAGTDPDPAWWQGFRDPVLADLMRRAIAGNLDLQQAVLRVVEARQNVVTARSAGLPMLNGSASYEREQYGFKGILDSKGIPGRVNSIGLPDTRSAIDSALTQATQPIDLYQYALDASWELDLFGRVRRSVEQARANEQAQGEAANDALVMLESQVGQAYASLRGGQALVATQDENVRAAESSLQLTQRRQRQGLASDQDVDQAKTQLLDQQRQLPSYVTQVQQAKNQLAVLTGEPPGTLDAMLAPAPLPETPDVVGIGVPSALARRRPDIRQAEANLHAATANVGVQVAMFYPDVSLSGNLGLRATDASYLTNWASRFYAAGPSVSIPIFQGGKLIANLRLARAQQAEMALKYRSTVLNGLMEVENALSSYHDDRASRDLLRQTVAAASDTLYLASNRYKNGLTDFLNVLNAQTTLTTARQNLARAEVTLIDDVVTLYRALGGGWTVRPQPS